MSWEAIGIIAALVGLGAGCGAIVSTLMNSHTIDMDDDGDDR